MNNDFLNFATTLIHGGPSKDPYTGASTIPVYQNSTFDLPEPAQPNRYDYSRSGNPSREALEETIASLEFGAKGLAFSSGIAAISSTLLLFKPGDRVVAAEDIYGGTYRALSTLFSRWGLIVEWVDSSDLQAIEDAAKLPNTVAILVESPSNPLLKVTDLRAVVQIAKKYELISIIDNTFMTPWLQNPIKLGFDISLHSATKFIGGHSDLVMGLAVTADPILGKKLYAIQNGFGAIPGIWECFLALRGVRTLGVRMDAQQRSAEKIVEWLLEEGKFKSIYYPSLESHRDSKIHLEQSSGGGAVFSFDLESAERAEKFLKSLKLPLRAVSLGGVETIVSWPKTMSHAAMPPSERQKRGISDGLIRVSVGLEGAEDLIQDFSNAFKLI